MLRLAHFRGLALRTPRRPIPASAAAQGPSGRPPRVAPRLAAGLAALLSVAATAQQPDIVRDGDRWRRDIHGSAPARHRLRINAHGPVTLQAGTGSTLTYTVRVSVRARSEAEASRVL